MKRSIVCALVLFLSCFIMSAGDRNKPSFAYGLDINTYFDNRENDAGGNVYTASMTIFSARVTPEIGLEIKGKDTRQSIMVGANLSKDFGSVRKGRDILENFLLYYNLEKKVSDRTHLGITAGVFPKKMGRGYYSRAFYSDSLKYYDPDYEGILFRFDKPKAYYELGVDWIGQKGPGNRERFMVFSAGDGRPLSWLKLGYSAYMYHFASSDEVHGVVDNILANAYVTFDATAFKPLDSMQELSLTLGYLQAGQQDRVFGDGYVFPGGAELVANARRWNVGVENRLYYGSDLMPFYNNLDKGGFKYGTQLYYGSPYYRVLEGKAAVYDRAEIFWEPKIAEGLYFKVAAVFHFNQGIKGVSGSQQIISIRYSF